MIGRVYEISNEDKSIVYIGSTTQTIKARWGNHKSNYKKWIDGKDRCHAMIYHSFKEHGIEMFSIKLISEHEIEDRKQLLEFEQKVIDKTGEVVNKIKSYTGIKAQDKKQYDDQYRDIYRKERNEQKRLYYHENKDRINTEIYKEKKNERQRRHYHEKRKQLSSQKIQCECGSIIRYGYRSEHLKKMKHIKWVESGN